MNRAIRFILLVCYCEAAAYGGLYLLDRYRNVAFRPADTLAPQQVEQLERLLSDDTTYLEHNSSLGWIIRPNAQKGPYRANAEGIRGDREYSLIAPGHRIRIASFGDSFTHGDDVANDATWQSALDRLQPNME